MFLNFKEAFTFMFKDKKFWQKCAIGTLINILPLSAMFFLFYQYLKYGDISDFSKIIILLGSMSVSFLSSIIFFFSVGYCVNYANAKITTGTNELPEWSGNFKNFFIDGFKLCAGLLLIGIFSGIIISILQIIFIIIAVIIGIIMYIIGLSDMAVLISLIILIVPYLLFLAIVYFSYAIFLNLASSSFLVDKAILSVFNFKRIRALSKNNILNLVLIILLALPIAIFSLLIYVSPILYFTLFIIFSFYFMLVFYDLLAQYVQIGTIKNQERLEEKKAQENLQENSQ